MGNNRLISRLSEIDWDFAGYASDSTFSSIHWYPARFASQLPATLIGLLSEQGERVLDPFAGSGTTLVEAQRLGRTSIGIDLHPIACKVSESKTLALSHSAIDALASSIIREAELCLVEEACDHMRGISGRSTPSTVQHSKWYTPAVTRQLTALWYLIDSYDGHKKILAEVAFSSSLLPVCRENRHWGYICDNTQPKGDHEGDVFEEFSKVLCKLCSAYASRDAELLARMTDIDKIAKSTVLCSSSLIALEELAESSVDTVVTSPPYFGVNDYIKAQRLTMEWFGFDIEALRLQEIGARSKRHRKSAREEYLKDMATVGTQLLRVLKPGGLCAFVIGESASRPAVHSDLESSFTQMGWKKLVSTRRVVSKQRRLTPSITEEVVLILGNG